MFTGSVSLLEFTLMMSDTSTQPRVRRPSLHIQRGINPQVFGAAPRGGYGAQASESPGASTRRSQDHTEGAEPDPDRMHNEAVLDF